MITQYFNSGHFLLQNSHFYRSCKEDVGLAYVIEKYDIRGVLFMII